MSEQITNKLSEVSNELEMPMDKVVEIMQKQVFTEGIVRAVMFGLGVGFIVFLRKAMDRFTEKKKIEGTYTKEQEEAGNILSFLAFLIIVGIVIASLCYLPSTINRFLNPDYYILQKLMNLKCSLE